MKKFKMIKRFFNLKNIRHLFKYSKDSLKFINLGGKISHFHPVMNEFLAQAGGASGHYYHQDLLVAQHIFLANPSKHLDIGSRIDGFVAHVATFRKIEIMDIRNLKQSVHTNIQFIQRDLMVNENKYYETYDSISCLHAIEHFGLGRYGDSIDPFGHIKGFNNMLKMLKKNGTLYISFPIGKSNEVHFNSQRVFDPDDIFLWANKELKINLLRFDFVDDEGFLHKNTKIEDIKNNVLYGCGIYTFKKVS
jgi:hypothetical protein